MLGQCRPTVIHVGLVIYFVSPCPSLPRNYRPSPCVITGPSYLYIFSVTLCASYSLVSDNIMNGLSEKELSGEEAQDRDKWRHLICFSHTVANILANVKNNIRGKFAKMIRLASRMNETSDPLQMVTNACEFLMNPCEFLTKLTIHFPNFL